MNGLGVLLGADFFQQPNLPALHSCDQKRWQGRTTMPFKRITKGLLWKIQRTFTSLSQKFEEIDACFQLHQMQDSFFDFNGLGIEGVYSELSALSVSVLRFNYTYIS